MHANIPAGVSGAEAAAAQELAAQVLAVTAKGDWKAFARLVPRDADPAALREVFAMLKGVKAAADPQWKCQATSDTVSVEFATAEGGRLTFFLKKAGDGLKFVYAQ